jgi:tripartite-type tricarboxylate transporter receptor subunit TctC
MRAVTNKRWFSSALLVSAWVLMGWSWGASAQTFPIKDKPITIVVPFSAGGPTDRLARDMAEALRKPLGGATVVVENVLGAGGAIATQKVAKAAPDGHTILIHHIGMATMPTLVRKPGFQVDTDFTYLGMIHEVPMTIVARPSLEANDYKQLTAWIAKHKDQVNLGNAGIGSASHLCGLLWQASLRTEMAGIPYKGVSMAINDLMGGQIDLLCDQTTNTMAYIDARKVKAYAITSSKRLSLPSLSGLPTMQELGVKGFQVSIWHGSYAPKGLSPEVQAKWFEALRSVLSDPAFVKKQEALGAVMITDKRISPEEHRRFVLSEIAKWSPIIKAAGVYAD